MGPALARAPREALRPDEVGVVGWGVSLLYLLVVTTNIQISRGTGADLYVVPETSTLYGGETNARPTHTSWLCKRYASFFLFDHQRLTDSPPTST